MPRAPRSDPPLTTRLAALAGGLALTVLAALALAGGLAQARPAAVHAPRARAAAAVPQGFVGVDSDGPLFGADTPIDFSQQIAPMVAAGVESIRVAFNWSDAQPYQTWAQVPSYQREEFTDVDGAPYDFQITDAIVAATAAAHITLLPTVLYTPPWDGAPNRNGLDTPARSGPYAAYLAALIDRYGPKGTFWSANPTVPKLPIREWQIWNEPNISYYWPAPFAKRYVSLLRAAHAAIKHADPGAKVVLGALTNLAWQAIGRIYRIHGARNLFDIVSVNGFTKYPSDVIRYLQYMRRAMDRAGDRRKPMIDTEVSWPSAQGKISHGYDFDTTESGQAHNIAALLGLVGRDRQSLGLTGLYYYTWLSDETASAGPFGWAGLLAFRSGRVVAKPALTAFRTGALTLEQCKRKGRYADVCIR